MVKLAYTQGSGPCGRKVVEVRILSGAPMKLWIDDERPAPWGWAHAKTAQEAIGWIEQGDITHISFDHDLGEGNGDGHDVVCFVEERIEAGQMALPQMTVHSANPVGARRIRQAIEAIQRRHGGLPEW